MLHASILYLIMHEIQLFFVVVCGGVLDESVIISHFPRFFGSAIDKEGAPAFTDSRVGEVEEQRANTEVI